MECCSSETGRQEWLKKEFPYDRIAQDILRPVFPVIAQDILSRTPLRAGRLLDVGCGGGHLGLALLERTQFTGYFIDLNQTALDIGRARAREQGLEHRAVFLLQDVQALDLPDHFAQLIVSRSSYHYWADLEGALRELYRVLAPGGLAYIGSGAGSRALIQQIKPRMQEAAPGWPDTIQARTGAIPTARLEALLTQNRIPHEILENEDQGRWMLLRRPAADGRSSAP